MWFLTIKVDLFFYLVYKDSSSLQFCIIAALSHKLTVLRELKFWNCPRGHLLGNRPIWYRNGIRSFVQQYCFSSHWKCRNSFQILIICAKFSFIILFQRNKSHLILVKVYGKHALSETPCRDWFQRFMNGDSDFSNKDSEKPPKKFEESTSYHKVIGNDGQYFDYWINSVFHFCLVVVILSKFIFKLYVYFLHFTLYVYIFACISKIKHQWRLL